MGFDFNYNINSKPFSFLLTPVDTELSRVAQRNHTNRFADYFLDKLRRTKINPDSAEGFQAT